MLLVQVLDRHAVCLSIGSDLKGDATWTIRILAGRLHGEDIPVVVGQRVARISGPMRSASPSASAVMVSAP